MPGFFAQLPSLLAQEKPFALGIITKVTGSSPQKKGTKALFFADGRIIGTLGGGCLEAEVRKRALEALRTQTPAGFELELDHDFGWDDGLLCGGKVTGLILPQAAQAADIWRQLAALQQPITWGVRPDFSVALADQPTPPDWLYVETATPPWALWIAGSGHIAQAVAPLAQQLEFTVAVFDDRPSLANHQHFPAETRIRVGGWEELLAEPWPRQPVMGLIVTRGHQHDALVLKQWIHRPFTFLGMIGSHRKARLLFTQFQEQGLARPEQLAQVACPVGLAIRAQTVWEIAVSIMAQYVQHRAECRLQEKI